MDGVQAPLPAGSTNGAANGSAPRESQRILIVEDNPVNQRLASLVLQKAGWSYGIANHGGEALELLEKDEYDLVLMDCQMPVMDGFEATRQIREAETVSSKHIPILALTANARTADRDACMAVGMDDFIAKPFKADHLVATVERWLAVAS